MLRKVCQEVHLGRFLAVRLSARTQQSEITSFLFPQNKEDYNYNKHRHFRKEKWKGLAVLGVVVGAGMVDGQEEEEDREVHIAQADGTKFRKTRMFQHFCSFASLKYKSEMYMTADDLFSAILSNGKTQQTVPEVRELDELEVDYMLRSTPTTSWTDKKGLFKTLGEKALISYPDFIFLVSLVSTPKRKFQQIFRLLDTNKNWMLDLEEFETLQHIFSKGVVTETENTTLKVHLFDLDGSGTISYDDFSDFLKRFQDECLEVEFMKYADKNNTMTDETFAKVLLSRTTLGVKGQAEYMSRVAGSSGKITLDQFRQFMSLLNDIGDLDVALRVFQVAKMPVTPEEFQRAIRVCTGHPMDERMLELTFDIFDDNGDGALSYEEFIKVMKERRRKQGTVDIQKSDDTWQNFTRCVHQQQKFMQ